MSVSFYDLQKYAKTGVASPEMTFFDRQKALALFGGSYPVTTITGVPPISFKSDGSALISLSMIGNGQQTGTPSPQSIIMPTFCGKQVGTDWTIPITCAGQTTPVYLGQTPTVRRIKKLVLTGDEPTWAQFENDKSRVTINGYLRQLRVVIGVSSHFVSKPSSASIPGYLSDGEFSFLVSSSGNNYVYFYNGDKPHVADFKQWLADQYAAGTPVCIWYILAEPETGIVNEPLCKIGDYADELNSINAGVIIQTAKGANTLEIGTTLQPSSVSITGHIKQ